MTAGTLDLLAQARQGDEAAAARVLEENSGLIWAVVRRYFGKGVEPDDLYQLGCLGFIKAVRGFDASYGTQFSTYAVPKSPARGPAGRRWPSAGRSSPADAPR